MANCNEIQAHISKYTKGSIRRFAQQIEHSSDCISSATLSLLMYISSPSRT